MVLDHEGFLFARLHYYPACRQAGIIACCDAQPALSEAEVFRVQFATEQSRSMGIFEESYSSPSFFFILTQRTQGTPS